MPIPFFGFSFLISIAIIVVSFFMRLLRFDMPAQPAEIVVYPKQHTTRIFTSLFIIASVLVVSVSVYLKIVHVASIDHRNTVNLAGHYMGECTPIPEPILHDRMVVLRLDDVQAHSWSSVNIRMMEDALARNMPVVAGVIPKDIENDFPVLSFLSRQECNVEIAFHGYTHHIERNGVQYNNEFATLSANEARTRLQAAIDEMRMVTQVPITTFIPPENVISADAHGVLSEFGILHLSSEGKGVFDYDTTTWEGVPAVDVVHACEERFAMGDRLCVIMLHPQEFSNTDMRVDEQKYQEFSKLLDLLETMEVSVVRFSDVSTEMLN
jgi:predicted deacetylase